METNGRPNLKGIMIYGIAIMALILVPYILYVFGVITKLIMSCILVIPILMLVALFIKFRKKK